MIAAEVGEGRENAAGEAIQTTIDADPSLEGLTEILEEEVLAKSGRDVVPRKNLVGSALPMGIEGRIEALLGECLEPGGGLVPIGPSIELGAAFPGRINDLGEAAIAP
jgi:hypothetical protein